VRDVIVTHDRKRSAGAQLESETTARCGRPVDRADPGHRSRTNPEQEAAVRQIEAFSNGQAKSDPHYPAVEAELLGRIDEMVKTQPPAAWAATVRRWYFSLSERAHSEERARIRSVERAAAGGIVAPSPAAPDKLVDRLQALEKDLLGGKLSPREHALHAFEAARAIFPSDTHLIALREIKVALATDYELGNITRGQYDERWARARAGYQQNADAREQRILDEMRAEQAATERRAGPSLGDRIRDQRGIRCTSTTAFGKTTTTCR
jgi:hypothetical protein